MKKTVRERIFELTDEKYRQFQSGLLPDTDNIIGVPLPKLRELAKELVKGDWRYYLATAQDDYYEEIMLQGLAIGYVEANIDEILGYVSAFIPKIKNWGICDSFCSSLKITKDHKKQVWDFLQPYLYSQEEFKIRFAVVMLINYYIEDEYIDGILALFDHVKHTGYYVKMAVAWAVSICFVKYPDITMRYLKKNRLDDFTFNKALQKIIESLCVDKETKAIIKGMKRK